MAIGLYVLNLGYGYEDSLKPLNEFHFISNLFSGNNSEEDAAKASLRKTAFPSAKPVNRFADSWLGQLPVPFPRNYLIGIDLQQKDFEDFGRPSYLRGEFQNWGWWYYYLYALMVKLPVGTWLLILLAVLWRIQFPKKQIIR